MPDEDKLESLFKPADVDRSVKIGSSPIIEKLDIEVDPNKLFGRHLAVLGNTGSGKSCSLTTIIRSCLKKSREKLSNEESNVNGRFILLDTNGEYEKAFSDLDGVRIFKVPPIKKKASEFKFPAWMFTSQEWASFGRARRGTQLPLLQRALRELKGKEAREMDKKANFFHDFKTYKNLLQTYESEGPTDSNRHDVGNLLYTMKQDIGEVIETDRPDKIQNQLTALQRKIKKVEEDLLENVTKNKIESDELDKIQEKERRFYSKFRMRQVRKVIDGINNVLEACPMSNTKTGANEDSPIEFEVSRLTSYLEQLARRNEDSRMIQYVQTFITRIDSFLKDNRMLSVLNPEESPNLTDSLENYIGKENAESGQICIIDLSLVPSNIINILISALARFIFEALVRYRKNNDGDILPTVLVLEEAHTFIPKGVEDKDIPTEEDMCRRVFERIAREGRKHGLGLTLSSQRPSELSETVLSQCNTFLLHRLVNHRDQDHVKKLVPDYLGNLLDELPNLPSREAVLLGWATPVPMLVEMNELDEKIQPESRDPDFWGVWTHQKDRPIDWQEIADDWTQSKSGGTTNNGKAEEEPESTGLNEEPQEGEGAPVEDSGDLNSEASNFEHDNEDDIPF